MTNWLPKEGIHVLQTYLDVVHYGHKKTYDKPGNDQFIQMGY
jgi:hypothetical protein